VAAPRTATERGDVAVGSSDDAAVYIRAIQAGRFLRRVLLPSRRNSSRLDSVSRSDGIVSNSTNMHQNRNKSVDSESCREISPRTLDLPASPVHADFAADLAISDGDYTQGAVRAIPATPSNRTSQIQPVWQRAPPRPWNQRIVEQ